MGRKVAAVVFSLGCLHANSVLALGLGELELESFLNEPLSASVDLLNPGDLHQDEIKVRLGTREDFKRLGMDRSFFLTSIQFEVVVDKDGSAKIVMSTDDPVLEPYLDFVVEARWPSGRLLREYTVLIDPPAFSESASVVSASQRVEEVEGIPDPAKKKAVAETSGTQVGIRESDLGPGEMPQRNFNAGADDLAPGSRYMIKRDDTLWRIASRSRPENASVHQTMLDIQRLNPDAFINNNINRVKAGYIIQLPSAGEISSADMEAALAEVREQNAAWREGRDAERAASSGPSLRISAEPEPEVPGDDMGSSGVARPSSQIAELEETLEDASADAVGGTRLAAMEERVDTLERIVDLKDDQIAALQAALAEAQATASLTDTGDSDSYATDAADDEPLDSEYDPYAAVEDIAEEVVEEPIEEPAVVDMDDGIAATEESATDPVAAADSDAAMDDPETDAANTASTRSVTTVAEPEGGILDYLWYIIGAAVLAIVGFIFVRRRSDEDDYEDVVVQAEPATRVTEEPPEAEPPPADSVAAKAAAVAGAPLDSERGYGERKHDAYADDMETADALAEADIYIAYGRHQQAIELLNNALSSEPTNPVYRLKLMEIHTELNNRKEASEQLHQLRSIGDQDSIERAEALLASMSDDVAVKTAPAEPAPAAEKPSADAGEPGLTPNPLSLEDDGETLDTEFSGLEIEEEQDAGELDLSEDFADDDEELVIAADANGMSTKLDLARAYIDMGDDDGARQILEEVIAEGNDDLKAEAQALLDRIG